MSGLTAAQLKIKETTLGGSEIAWALGYGVQAPSVLWEIKRGLRPVEENDLMWFGTVIEENALRPLAERLLRRMYADDLTLIKPETVFHAQLKHFWAVHPDAISWKHKICVQIKNHDPRVERMKYSKPAGYDDNFNVPLDYQMQVLWERGALLSRGSPEQRAGWTFYLAPYFGGIDLRLYKIGPNARLLDAMTEQALKWWDSHLDPNGPQSYPDDSFWAKNRDRLQAAKDAEPKPLPRATKAEIAEQPITSLESLA